MGGKERSGARFGLFVQVFHDGPSNADAVVCRRSAPQLVEKNQRTGRNIVENVRCFGHFYHESRLALRNIVARPHARKDFIYQSNARTFGRNKAAYLRK